MKKALALNAVFSSVSGIVLVGLNKSIAEFFGVANSNVFWIIGAALLFFLLNIVLEIKRQNPVGILWIVTQDLLWVFGSIVILILQPFDLTSEGNYAIATVALVVLGMGINQARHLSKLDELPGENVKQLEFKRTVNASKHAAWQVVSDVANYHQVAPNIDDVKIVSGERKGMIRQCSHGRNAWTETCSMWNEGEAFSFIVNTNASDYPYPLSYLSGTWQVESIGEDRTVVRMIYRFAYRRKIMNVFLHPLMKNGFDKVVDELLNNWQKQIEAKGKSPGHNEGIVTKDISKF
ncbi:MAG: type II toxin-antitoxin system RatA family toxin [Bacteroidota bacterium]